MSNKNEKKWINFIEGDNRWMICKHCQSEYCIVDDDTISVSCSGCTQIKCLQRTSLEEMMPSLRKKKSTGRPTGWHFMNEFVDKDGNVFHKGKEQPELKGTLEPTKVKPPKKRKKLTEDEKLKRDLKNWKKRLKAKRGSK